MLNMCRKVKNGDNMFIITARDKSTNIPEIPEELFCCQSGCAKCVWIGKGLSSVLYEYII